MITVQPGSVPVITELPGRLEASRVAQVRARAAGIVQKRLFTEGSEVKAGQPLFQIDASTYQATLSSAQAAQAKAEANLTQATALLERYKPLQAAKAISPQEFLNAQVAQRQAQADVAATQAAVQTARINLGYASVTSPIAGRIGRALVTEGALVGQGEATPLAVVQQVNMLYVNFTQPATEVVRLRQALSNGTLKRAGVDAASIRVVLDDGSSTLAWQASVLGPERGRQFRPGRPACRVAQPARPLAAGHVCARSPGASPGRRRHPAAPAGRHPRGSGRHRDGGR